MTTETRESFPTPIRRQQICELLNTKKALGVEELRNLFQVSGMTIRRDLIRLEHEGRLHRTRGGAEQVRTQEYEPSYHVRVRENQKEKDALARKACEYVNDGDVIFVDIGSTMLSFVRELAKKKQVTVLTNWIPNVLELAKSPHIRTVLLGGTLRNEELSLIGGMTRDMLCSFNADKAFIGVGGLSSEKGLTDYNMDEVEVKKAMIKTASEAIVLADHSKIERVAPISVCGLNEIALVIVDDGVQEKQLDLFKSKGLNIAVAAVSGSQD